MIDFDQVTRVYSLGNKDPKTFSINWRLGTFCNYSCSYCWPTSHSSTYDYKKLVEYTLFLDDLVDKVKEEGFTTIKLIFLGGEPTTFREFLPFLNHINSYSDIEFKIDIITNLSPSKKFWERLKENSRVSFNIIASYHSEFVDVKTFVEKVKYLKDSLNYSIVTTMVMSPKNFSKLLEDAYYIKENVDRCKFTVQYDHKGRCEEYTSDMFSHIDTLNSSESKNKNYFILETPTEVFSYSSADFVITNNFYNFVGWNCNAGSSSIVINHIGDIKRCWSGVDEKIGTIKSGFKLKKQRCITKSCLCAADLDILKEKNNG